MIPLSPRLVRLVSAVAAVGMIACCNERKTTLPAASTSASPSSIPAQGNPRFTDVSSQAGLVSKTVNGSPEKRFLLEAKGLGCAFLDYDGDGFQDLYIVSGTTFDVLYGRNGPLNRPVNRLYRNRGDGTFEDVTVASGTGDPSWSYGVTVADYDRDGDPDLYVTNYGPNRLFRNNGDGTFTDTAVAAGVEAPLWSTGAAFGDYDADGDLDLYVASFVEYDFRNPPQDGKPCPFMGFEVMCGPMGLPGAQDYLFRNNGDGTFSDVTLEAGLIEKSRYYGFTPVFEDFDNDGLLDIYVPNDSCPNYLYRNKGDGTFEEIGSLSGTAYNAEGKEQASMGIAVEDYDRDGYADIFLTHFSDDYNVLYRNDGAMSFSDVSESSGLAGPSWVYCAWGTFFIDYDNDMDLDLFVANGHVYPVLMEHPDLHLKYQEPNQMFEHDGKGKFTDVSAGMGKDFLVPKVSRGSAYADYDNDGDVDICITNMDDTPTLLRNDAPPGNHWVTFILAGTASNPDAVGSLVRVRAGGVTQSLRVRSGGSFLSHSDMRPRFGLAKNTRIDSVEIRWSSGLTQTLHGVPVDRFVEVEEGNPQFRSRVRPGQQPPDSLSQ